MDFKSYPNYKNSGVEWLGVIPEHWQQKPIWSLFSRVKRVNHPNEPLLSVYRDYGVIPKASRDDNHNRASEDLTPYQLVRPNDLVINKMKAWQGSIAISEHQGIVSPAYYVYEPKQLYCSKYIHFLIRSTYFIQSYKNFSKGIRVNQWDLEHDAFTHINLLLPPLSEQNKIVSFLDTETLRIDHLIAKQEKLIEKLEEHRKSIISHAVTKGLDPNVAMRDSGIEWLGEVPEHWSVSKLRYYLDGIKDGTHGSHISVEHGKLLLSGKNIKNGKLVINENERRIRLDDHEKITANGFPKKDDLLISVVGTIGQSCIYELEEPISFQRSVCFLRPNAKLKAIFLQKLLESNLVQNQLIMLTNKATVGGVYMGDLVELIIPIIPVDEQSQIANFLDSESSRINILITKQKELIEKLKEYRTSIISHAVTGKIDVRDLVA